MASLRLALFTGNYNHIADGVSLTLNRLVRHLLDVGIEVLVFGPTIDEPALDHAGELVAVPSMAAPGRPEYRVARGLSAEAERRLAAFAPALVHIATPDLLGLAARRWALRRGVPLVSTYHTHFSSYLAYYRLAWLEGGVWSYLRWFYGACRHLYVPTPSMIEVLQAHGLVDGLRLWPRGVETERFHPDRRDLDWRRALGIGDDEAVVAYVSRLVWEKAPDVFAATVERLRAEGVPHRSLIVGDGPARADLEARLPETIFTGYLGGVELARAYASADVFVFPSASETFGNVTLEAMASGLPTVCADATGSRTLVAEGTTGYLAAPGDVDAFYAATRRLVTDPEHRTALGHAAHIRAQQYAWPAVLDQMVAYYHEALADQPRSAS